MKTLAMLLVLFSIPLMAQTNLTTPNAMTIKAVVGTSDSARIWGLGFAAGVRSVICPPTGCTPQDSTRIAQAAANAAMDSVGVLYPNGILIWYKKR